MNQIDEPVLEKDEIRSRLYQRMRTSCGDFAKSVEIQEALFQFGVIEMTEAVCRDRLSHLDAPTTAAEVIEREIVDLKLQLTLEHMQIKLIEAFIYLRHETREANAGWINEHIARYDSLHASYKQKRSECSVLRQAGLI